MSDDDGLDRLTEEESGNSLAVTVTQTVRNQRWAIGVLIVILAATGSLFEIQLSGIGARMDATSDRISRNEVTISSIQATGITRGEHSALMEGNSRQDALIAKIEALQQSVLHRLDVIEQEMRPRNDGRNQP